MRNTALIISLILVVSIYALPESSGTCGMTFLKMDYSPRSSALGQASVGFADGPDGMMANPAQMSFERNMSVQSSFGLLYGGITLGSIAGQREFDFGRLGFHVKFVSYGSMDRTDEEGQIIGSFGSTDMAFSVLYSREITENISIGLAPFFASSSIDTFSALAVGTDFGALYRFDRGKGRVGFGMKNLGTEVSAFVDTTDPLPIIASLGASYRLKGLPVYALAQGDWSQDAGFSGGFGMEIIQFKPVYLRLGYRIRPLLSGDLVENEFLNGMSAGFGVKTKNIFVDYSFQHYGSLGFTHKFALAYDGFSN